MNSIVLRQIADSDLEGLKKLAASHSGGITSLPNEETFLEDRIHESIRSFDPTIKKPGSEVYLFVLEDIEAKELAGTSSILARIGGFEPFYSYEIRPERIHHEPLGIDKEIELLHLKMDHKGPSEIGSLLLNHDYRKSGLGRLLSLSRFLFVATFPERFDEQIIAELRGYIDEDGRSPFWETVGQPFFEHDFYTADALSGLGNKEFIHDLMPKYPIYVDLLPPQVQSVIGRVHRNSGPALNLLYEEGFVRTNEVDIFDAGPLVSVAVRNIRTIRECRQSEIGSLLGGVEESSECIVANPVLDFRASYGVVEERDDGSVGIAEELAALLKLRQGDTLTYVPTRKHEETQ